MFKVCFASESDRKMVLKSLQSNRESAFSHSSTRWMDDDHELSDKYQEGTFSQRLWDVNQGWKKWQWWCCPAPMRERVWMEMALPAPRWGSSCSDTCRGRRRTIPFLSGSWAEHMSCCGLPSCVCETGNGSSPPAAPAGWQGCSAGQLWSGSCNKKEALQWVCTMGLLNVLSLHHFLGSTLNVFNPNYISP